MIRELTLHGGMPALAYGEGPPLVFIRTILPNAGNPTGMSRLTETRQLNRLTRGRTIYSIGRRPGRKAGTTMADLAADVAEAILRKFREPVEVMGFSTGGSIALQVAADRPDAVTKLVACATAYRLGPVGKQVQRDYRDRLARGEYRGAISALVPGWVDKPLPQKLLKQFMSLDTSTPEDPDGMIAMLDAEDGCDVDCEKIAAPTLLIAGDRDRFHPRDLVEQTAHRIPDATLKLYPGRGHVNVVRDKSFYPDIIRFLVNR
ncbi:alpha/beta fold hydrolase [Kibdelosporangium aridum]|uniref:alpha/beta fold hydrolase n=1 Tax=Kibdelosporangium aridum TaxID=2030 RepID=UPI00068F39D7